MKGKLAHLSVTELLNMTNAELNEKGNGFDVVRRDKALKELSGNNDDGAITMTFKTAKGFLKMFGNKIVETKDKAIAVGAETLVKDKLAAMEEIKEQRVEAKKLLAQKEFTESEYQEYMDELDIKELKLSQ